GDLYIIEVVVGFRALILGEHRERRGREAPLALHAPRPGLEIERPTANEVGAAVGIHHRAFDHEVRIDEITAGAADEPGVDAVNAPADCTKRAVVADLAIEGELVPVPLRLTTNHAMPLSTRITSAPEHAEQILLRIAPAPMATDQIAASREMATLMVVIGCAFRLRVDLYAHAGAHPVVATTGSAERPAIEPFGPVTEVDRRARPAGVDLDVAGRLIDSARRLHRLHVGRLANRCQRKQSESADASLPQRH